jgi:hypothetical protein
MPAPSLRFALAAFAYLAIALGVVNLAFAASNDCNGIIKWNGSTSSPSYQWRLNSEDLVVFCPPTNCSTQGKVCTIEVAIPDPPSTTYNHNCGCDDGLFLCSTNVQSNGPWGPITGVTCITGQCASPKHCELTTISQQDPNGMYNAQCHCR